MGSRDAHLLGAASFLVFRVAPRHRPPVCVSSPCLGGRVTVRPAALSSLSFPYLIERSNHMCGPYEHSHWWQTESGGYEVIIDREHNSHALQREHHSIPARAHRCGVDLVTGIEFVREHAGRHGDLQQWLPALYRMCGNSIRGAVSAESCRGSAESWRQEAESCTGSTGSQPMSVELFCQVFREDGNEYWRDKDSVEAQPYPRIVRETVQSKRGSACNETSISSNCSP